MASYTAAELARRRTTANRWSSSGRSARGSRASAADSSLVTGAGAARAAGRCAATAALSSRARRTRSLGPVIGHTLRQRAIVLSPPLWRLVLISLGQEPGPHEQRPEVAWVVVGLVVVHLGLRCDTEPERRQLEEALAAPRRDVDDADPTGREQRCSSAAVASGSSRCSSTLLQMMASMLPSATSPAHRAGARAAACGPVACQRRVDRDVDEEHGGGRREELHAERRVMAAADVGRPPARRRRRGTGASARWTASGRAGRPATARGPARRRSMRVSRDSCRDRWRSPPRG